MKNKIVYKLTDKFGQTRGMTKWGNNVSHTAKGKGKVLCSNGWIHYYTHPLLAVLMNPIHAKFASPKLWEAEASGKILDEALKSGCKTLKTIKEIPLPEVSKVQRVAFGILCGKDVCKDKEWNLWADKWLSGADRSKESASAAYAAALAAADDAATYYATYYAANAAARAADAANAAADAATYYATYYAASAAASAAARAADAKSINFIELAEKAMTYK